MDKTKQPGIKIEALLLVESDFIRAKFVPENFQNTFTFDSVHTESSDGRSLTTELTVIVNSKKDPIYLKTKFAGIFSKQEDSENMSFEEFANTGSPVAIIFAYAREEISSRFMKAGLPEFGTIPIVNVKALTKLKSTTKKGKKKSTK